MLAQLRPECRAIDETAPCITTVCIYFGNLEKGMSLSFQEFMGERAAVVTGSGVFKHWKMSACPVLRPGRMKCIAVSLLDSEIEQRR